MDIAEIAAVAEDYIAIRAELFDQLETYTGRSVEDQEVVTHAMDVLLSKGPRTRLHRLAGRDYTVEGIE